MKYILIFDHPYTLSASNNQPHHRSYSAAVAKQTIDYLTDKGNTVDVIDLHQDRFDPVMHEEDLTAWRTKVPISAQVDNYFERLKVADEIIFIFPIWWELMPAMTKGFIDKAFSKNRAVSMHPRVVLEKNPVIRIFTIAGTPTFLYRLKYGNPIIKAMATGTFKKIGLKKIKWHNFNAEDESPQKRQADLTQIQKYLS
ncbi:NAD(P)H-dependent oxidoreductase [Lentilactobacillus parakefiri]|uniref:NADPH:quinone reductase n=1 Tax=Lentilactobacillus parakefiri TaxID=152332 RepID=A0A269YCD7_9LACO|nr:NAD(P)H-dependent oxidoreductase [Lentilactobacillus parakefiri]PAK83070.1 NADPH:quinone reductase [Lentilactobacillus parakefiri]